MTTGPMRCLSVILVIAGCHRASRAEPVRTDIAPLATIDPAAAFDDLAPLGRRIGTTNVVSLGEPSHADPTFTRAQHRLVRYLHEALGFDVLLWETSLFGCHDANAHLADGTFRADRCFFRMWAESAQIAALLEYVNSTRASAHPLVLEGIDPQLAGESALEDFGAWVRSIAVRYDPALSRSIAIAVARFPKLRFFRPLTVDERDADRAAFEALARRVASDPDAGATGFDAAWTTRVLESAVAIYRWHEAVHAETTTHIAWNEHPEANDVRDAAMAANALWFIRERYRGHRVMIWSATFHALRHPETLSPPRRFVSMGGILADALDPGPRVIALTSSSDRESFGSHGEHCIENTMRARGMRLALIDVASAMPGNGCTLALGLEPFSGRWSAVLDDLVFVDRAGTLTMRRDD